MTLPRWSLVAHIADAAGHVVCFASDREALLRAHPEYKALILAEVDICERDRPVWLAVMSDDAESVIVGTNLIGAEPRWWLALRAAQESGR